MPDLVLSPYGVNQTIPLTGVFHEWPATWRDPRAAPIVVLVDEEHETPTAVDQNARNVHRLLQAAPGTVVVLEHFPAGQNVTASSPRTYGGSDFHIRLHKLGPANTIGGDDVPSLGIVAGVEAHYAELRRQVNDTIDVRDSQSIARAKAEEDRLKQEGYQVMHGNPANVVRSERLIETTLTYLASNGIRIGVINAGANHNAHIWDNVVHNGQPICPRRHEVTFIRLRPAAHPTPLVVPHGIPHHGPAASLLERRHVTAYFQWIDRGKLIGQEMVDWSWSEQKVTS